MAIVGIDLGTTNTVVGVVREGHASAIRDAESEYLIPSVVSFHPGGHILVGRGAKERRTVDAANTIYSIKRLIGRSWNSEEIARARTRFPFEMREGPGQAALVVARGETFTLPEISAFVLRHAKALAEKAIGEPVDRAVITVPANFNDLQRAATKVAGRVAGLEVLRILNEPTAAALAYGYGKGKGERIAIYDFGGGTFDVTLLDLSGNVFEVLATAGNTFLGGDDIDLAVADRMAEACRAQFQLDAHADPQVFERLRYYAEKLKVALSTSPESTIEVPDVGVGPSGRPLRLTFTMTSHELDEVARPIVERTFQVCQQAVGIARLSPRDFDQIVLVGGSTRLPIVRARVAEYFGRQPLDRINPDEVVAIGAAIQANALTGHERRRSVIPRPPMPAARNLEGSVASSPLSEPPVRAKRRTDPLGPRRAATMPRLNSPAAQENPDGTRKRVITGIGLGHGVPPPAQGKSSRPPPLPHRRTAPPVPGGGSRTGTKPPILPKDRIPARSASSVPPRTASSAPPRGTQPRPVQIDLSDDLDLDFDEPTHHRLKPSTAPESTFDPDTPSTPYNLDDEPTRVGAPPEIIEAARAARESMPASAPTPSQEPPPPVPVSVDDSLDDDEVTRADARFGGKTGTPPGTTKPSSKEESADDHRLSKVLVHRPQFARTRISGTPPSPPRTPVPETRRTPTPTDRYELPLDTVPDVAVDRAALMPEPAEPFAPAEPFGAIDPFGGIEPVTSTEPFAPAEPVARRLDVPEPSPSRPPLPLLVDVTPLSLCVETVSGFRDVIIGRNTPVPCEQSRTFVTAHNNQEIVIVRVGQGESPQFAANTLLGEVELSGLRVAPRGAVHIVVTFSLDTDGMLDVRAADPETGKASTARLRLVGLPDAEEVGRMTQRHQQRQGSLR